MSIIQYTNNPEFFGATLTVGHVGNRHAYAYADGELSLYGFNGGVSEARRIRCRSYRRAVRLLRMYLKGYNV